MGSVEARKRVRGPRVREEVRAETEVAFSDHDIGGQHECGSLQLHTTHPSTPSSLSTFPLATK